MLLILMIGLISPDSQSQIIQIGNVKIGGKPGELPTMLIGSIFYEGDKTVEDPIKGVFDEERAEELVEKQSDLSMRTGNPHMIDIMGISSEAMHNYIDFISVITDAPILIDSTSAEAKISSIKYAKEVGLIERLVYNSINSYTREEEILAIREAGVKSAIILASNPTNAWPIGRIKVLEGESNSEGLLSMAERAGIENILLDSVVIDVPGIGIAAEAIQLIKKQFSLPAGAAPCNAVFEWKRVKEFGPQARNINSANAASILQMVGADFILYGPIRMSEVIFPACAMTDAVIAYGMRKHGVKPSGQHPLYRIF